METTTERIRAILAKVDQECPETPYIGSDEWDLNDAFAQGWRSAIDAIVAALPDTKRQPVD